MPTVGFNPQPQYMSCPWIIPNSRRLNPLSHHVLQTHEIALHKNSSPASPDKDTLLTGSCYRIMEEAVYGKVQIYQSLADSWKKPFMANF